MITPPRNDSGRGPGPHDAVDISLDEALRGMHRDLMSQPLPARLLQAGQRLDAERLRHTRQWRGAAMAASVLLAFGVGWLSHGQWTLASRARQAGTQDFVRQAGFAHAVYQPELRHAVEVDATQQEHLVQWLSKRLGRPLKVPQLGAQGFDLVGGRLLPGEQGARAQFMFQSTAGERVTLYLGAIDAQQPGNARTDTQGTQFRFESDGAVPSFYWVEDGFGYALSGPVEKARLLTLATAVYQQLH